jgi:molecular chaperone DnaJ
MNKDYYKTLNINRNATQDEIKKAFRTLSKTHHPDKGGNENTFKEMSEAYDTLSDEKKRQKYDMGGKNPFGDFGGGGPSPDDLFHQFFGRRQQRRQVRKGRNLNIPLKVTLEDVYLGSVKTLRYRRNVVCKDCTGTGGRTQQCTFCNGKGRKETIVGNAFFKQMRTEICNPCKGTGRLVINACNSCVGQGYTDEDKTIDFKVPHNLQTGQQYSFRLIGDEIVNGEPGDLFLEVVILPHQHFKLLGKDLIYEPNISVIDLMIGTQIDIPHFDGKITATVKPDSNIHDSFQVRGKGMLNGNLIIKPKISLPKNLNSHEVKTLQEIKISRQ